MEPSRIGRHPSGTPQTVARIHNACPGGKASPSAGPDHPAGGDAALTRAAARPTMRDACPPPRVRSTRNARHRRRRVRCLPCCAEIPVGGERHVASTRGPSGPERTSMTTKTRVDPDAARVRRHGGGPRPRRRHGPRRPPPVPARLRGRRDRGRRSSSRCCERSATAGRAGSSACCTSTSCPAPSVACWASCGCRSQGEQVRTVVLACPPRRAARPAARALRRDAARAAVARREPGRQHPDDRRRRGRALPAGRRVRARRRAPLGLRVADAGR